MMEELRIKAAEIVGKVGIVAAPASEAVEKAGWFGSMTGVQFVSMAGVVWLMIERTNKGIFEAKDKGKWPLVFVSIQWALLWSVFVYLVAINL